MIVVVHDKATDHLDRPKDREFYNEWYEIGDLLKEAWGESDNRETGDVKAYWGNFFENLSQEGIFDGGTKSSPFAKGMTTMDQERSSTPESREEDQGPKRTTANLGGIDPNILYRFGKFGQLDRQYTKPVQGLCHILQPEESSFLRPFDLRHPQLFEL